ncbi:MAG: transposase, partial [Candidatus Entotheonella gemina]
NLLFLTMSKKNDEALFSEGVRRWSIDCKATVKIGDFSRGGYTRGHNRANDHDMGCKEKYTPCGIVDEDSGELYINFGSSYKTSDFIVDTIESKWNAMDEQEKSDTSLIQIKMDNGPESGGRRTQFLYRMVEFADLINRPIQLLYYPPYHSKYNPIERCWGILELKWNGAKLIDAETMLGWAKSMTWKGLHPVVELSRQVYTKGISLGQAAMRAVEARLKRDPELPKYDILITPVSTS